MHSDNEAPRASYDESPRPKLPASQTEGEEGDEAGAAEYEDDFDEDEMIDVAEKIFIRVAE